MGRPASDKIAWILNVPCPKDTCRMEQGRMCVSGTGREGPPHAARIKEAIEEGLQPPDSSQEPVTQARPAKASKKLDEVEVMALADMLRFSCRFSGEHAFFLGVARILLELGYKP